MSKEEKPVIFQGTGYRVVRQNPLNVALEVLNTEGVYAFQGYFQTIERALIYAARNDSILFELETKDLDSYLQSIREVKETIVNDIKNLLENGVPEEAVEEDIDEYDLLG